MRLMLLTLLLSMATVSFATGGCENAVDGISIINSRDDLFIGRPYYNIGNGFRSLRGYDFRGISPNFVNPPPPVASYNPTLGTVSFSNTEYLARNSFASIWVDSTESKLLPENTQPLGFSSDYCISPSINATDQIRWYFSVPFSSPIDQSVYAGNIIEPGTDISDLTFYYSTLDVEAALSNVVIVPEPSSLALAVASTFMVILFFNTKRTYPTPSHCLSDVDLV